MTPTSASRLVRVFAPYKLSLAGEHAVGHGGSSVVAALDTGVTLHLSAVREPWVRISHGARHHCFERTELVDYRQRVDDSFRRRGPAAWHAWAGDDFAPFRYLAGLWLARHHVPPFAVRSRDRGWTGCGLGTSSASAAALVLGCATLAGEPVDGEEIERQVLAADRLRHGGIPSGVDGAVVVRGGGLRFAPGRRSDPPQRRALPLPELRVLLVHTGVSRSCNRVIAAFAAQPRPRIDSFVRRMEEITARVAAALESRDLQALFDGVEADRRLLREYALTSPMANELAALARRAGAGAAKLTGAGVGGALFALFAGPVPPALPATLRQRGLRTAGVRFGRRGCHLT